MAHMENRASKAIDVFLNSGGGGGSGTPPAPPAFNANATDPTRFVTMIALQNRLLNIMAEAQTIVQHLQENGFFPRGSGANPRDDAASIITQMLRASLDVSNTSVSASSGMGSGSQSTLDAAGAQWAPSPNSASMPPAVADDEVAAAPWKTESRPRGNAAEEPLAPPSGNGGKSQQRQAHPTATAPTGTGAGADAGAGAGAATADRSGEEESDTLSEGTEMLAFVEFKRGRVRKYKCDRRIEPGNYVLVDGDRGTDCGLLVQTIERKPNNETAVVSMEGSDIRDEKIKLEKGSVLRQASEDDIDRLHKIVASAEAVALKTCRQRCQELGIDIDLQDVEYQFDLKKVSFFFDCDHSVDFRVLVREMYRTFGARIWMENINPKVKNSMPDSGSHDRGHGNGGGGSGGYRGHGGNGGGGGWRNNHRGNHGWD
ncbi:cell cycle sequence binding phosphoprotein (RBP33) [Novymonas esmeraldas]|uniref:Cell cycle sequence binding phosphoprotein (RBP33) n=1 Tax=Novymonas esmeraldas TaxID=1808958 RepID=A0AAW0EP85_9TRYP